MIGEDDLCAHEGWLQRVPVPAPPVCEVFFLKLHLEAGQSWAGELY